MTTRSAGGVAGSLMVLAAAMVLWSCAGSPGGEPPEPLPAPCRPEEVAEGRHVPVAASAEGVLLAGDSAGVEGPRLVNSEEVQHALIREYVTAGLAPRTGRVLVRPEVDVTGRLTSRRVVGSSGRTDLDRAAIRVVEVMRFAPATMEGCAVPAWLAIPVTFEHR